MSLSKNPLTSPAPLCVNLGERSYPIHIGPGHLANIGELIRGFAPSKRVVIITDETVYGLHGKVLENALSDYTTAMIVRPAGESQKSMAGLETVLEAMFRAGLDRTDLLLAFGGGVIGDLAGFAASIYKRGLPFVQIPTTLLAQVDSSVGGKTAINNSFGKNLIGAFYQPRAVIADTDLLSTLPLRQLKAGYAEVLKYGLLGDRNFFDWLEAEGGKQILALDTTSLSKAVRVSCQTKARIVAADERETGQRALLNLGHSFAHALELDAGYDGDLLHGEAVSAGMEMAFYFSVKAGYCSAEDAKKVSEHLSNLDMPRLSTLGERLVNPTKLTRFMGQDKKNEAGKITLILARAIGEAFVEKAVSDEEVISFLTALSENDVSEIGIS